LKIPKFWVQAAAFLIVTSAAAAAAQPAQSFDQLQILIKPGDTILVTDLAGITTKGKVTELSRTVLGLSVNGKTQDLSEMNIDRIRQWRSDSLKNGALIGLGVGIGMGTLGSFFCERSDNSCKAAMIVTSAGVYTAVGVGIDALIASKQTIYVGRTRTTALGFRIRPILQPARRGIAMAVSF
jgi:hypothetical protein